MLMLPCALATEEKTNIIYKNKKALHSVNTEKLGTFLETLENIINFKLMAQSASRIRYKKKQENAR